MRADPQKGKADMGFNNGYDSGWADASAKFELERRALQKKIADLTASQGSTTPTTPTILEVSPSAIVLNQEDPDVPGTTTIDLSSLAVGQTAHITEPAGTFEASDACFQFQLPTEVTQIITPGDTTVSVPAGEHSVLSDPENPFFSATGLGGDSPLDAFAVRTSETTLYIVFITGRTE